MGYQLGEGMRRDAFYRRVKKYVDRRKAILLVMDSGVFI